MGTTIISMLGGRWIELFALLALAACAPAPESYPQDAQVRYRAGDDPAWARPDWDDRDWAVGTFSQAPAGEGLHWARMRLVIPESTTLGLRVSAVAAREVFWDGVPIGGAGQVGASLESEVAGPIDLVLPIPDALAAAGAHTVAVRFSTFRRPPDANGLLLLISTGELGDLLVDPLRSVALPLVFLGGFLMVGCYFVGLYCVDRGRVAYLIMGLLCVAVALLMVAECWRDAVGYDYTEHGHRLRAIEGLTWVVGMLLTAAYSLPFAASWRTVLLAALTLASAAAVQVIEDHEALTYTLFAISLGLAVLLTGWAVWRRRSGAGFALAGVGVCLAALLLTGRNFMEGAFFPAFGTLVVGSLVSLSLQTRAEAKRYSRTLAAKARLEAELLKKHLQPHFLMNTLTSIMEWVETDPPRGARAMEALAEELRSLSEVSGRSRITLEEELALCRAHLAVMGFRRGVAFELEVSGVDGAATIPPALLHTLIENAITHNAYAPGEVVFRLDGDSHKGRQHLCLRTPLAGPAREDAPEGGGSRYVRARLEESAPGSWTLDAGVEQGEWVVRLGFPAQAVN